MSTFFNNPLFLYLYVFVFTMSLSFSMSLFPSPHFTSPSMCVSFSLFLPLFARARYSAMVEQLLMMQLVIRSIHYGGPFQIFLVPSNVPQLVYQRLWYVLSSLWDSVYERLLAVNQKE